HQPPARARRGRRRGACRRRAHLPGDRPAGRSVRKPEVAAGMKALRRVVVTGMGIVSCIGTNASQVLASLREGRSGISFVPEYAELGFRSQVAGRPDVDLDAAIDRKLRRFMGDGAAYLHLSMEQAIADAGLDADEVSNERTGIIVGSGGPSTRNQVEAAA